MPFALFSSLPQSPSSTSPSPHKNKLTENYFGMMALQKPLMLKDYLELDLDAESSGAGFQCAPRRSTETDTVRRLVDADLLRGGGGERRWLPRTRSTSALSRISALINAVKMLPFATSSGSSSSPGGLLSRSFSRRMKANIWRKKPKSEEVYVTDGRRSCDLPPIPPVSVRCSSWLESASAGSEFLYSSIASVDVSGDGRKASSRGSPRHSPKAGTSVGDESPKMEENTLKDKEEDKEYHSSEEEDKEEQLSPVSVMDFPSLDEEEDDEEDGKFYEAEDVHASPSSLQYSLTKLQRKKLYNIGQLKSVADLHPVNLDSTRFASCDDDDNTDDVAAVPERKAWDLHGQLMSACHFDGAARAQEPSVEKLLVDFFIYGLMLSSSNAGEAEEDEQELISVAREWIEETRWGDVGDRYDCLRDEAALTEMGDRGWCRSLEEEGELGAGFERLVLASLLEELVVDLASTR